MHKKGAKLSLVHLFGLSKINRDYIQKGREIRRNMKRMKKVLSIVLSLAMILTSITVYNTKTAKADDGDIAEVVFTAQTKLVKENTQIDAYWEKIANSAKDMVYIYDSKEAESITAESTFEEKYSAVSSNINWCWNRQGGVGGQKADGICRNYGDNGTSTLYTKNGGDYTIVVVSYDADGNVVAFGKKTLTTIKYSTSITNTKLNLVGTNCTELGTENPRFTWNSVAKAEKYILTATDDGTGTILKTWKITDNLTKELSFNAKEVQNGKAGTYTMRIEAYDENGTLIVADEDDVTSVGNCVKYYSENKYLNFKSDGKEASVLKNDGPRVYWNTVENAEKYVITATDDETGATLKTWEFGKTTTEHYFWNSDVKDGKAGTYTLTITAYDASNQIITPQDDDTYQIKSCAKYYEAPALEEADKTEENVEQTGYTNAEDIKDWKKLEGRTSDGSTAWISQAVYDSMAAHECNGLLPAGDPVGGKQKYNISSNLKAVDVFAFVAKDGWPTAVVINGTRYLNATANTLVYVGNDCVYINQSLLTIPEGQNTADYVITPEGSNGTPTFVLQLRKDERFTVSINGNDTEKVEANKTYTLPIEENVEYYYNNGKIYKPGTEVEITKDIDFVTINNISVNLTNGAAIRIDDNQAGGIRFKADVDVTCGVDSEKNNIINAVQTGILLTTQDKLDKANNAELNIDNIETIGKVLNIENKGWFNDKVGSYCASLVNIVEANYPRTFVARAYIKVTSNDGVDYVYSQDNGDEYSKSVIRTIKGIANSIFKDKTEFNGYSDDEKSLIKKFAGIVDTAE